MGLRVSVPILPGARLSGPPNKPVRPWQWAAAIAALVVVAGCASGERSTGRYHIFRLPENATPIINITTAITAITAITTGSSAAGTGKTGIRVRPELLGCLRSDQPRRRGLRRRRRQRTRIRAGTGQRGG
jgi:hypothetical protein